MATSLAEIISGVRLSDPALFRQQCYVDGEWVDADSGATFDVTDPATGQPIGVVPSFGAAETRRAVEAANAAYPAWRALTGKERASILRRWYDLMLEHQEDLAVIMTAEQGKPMAESRGEIVFGASFIEWFAEEAKRAYGDVIPTHLADRRIVVTKEPAWRGGLHHALELPQRHDHAQGRARAGRGLHGGRAARFVNATLGTRTR